ncbi:MAG: gliding motility-associated C-terminal domain-containing protein [Saprospiraceae bacterium]|nr:gliding motility-associated C-terminal domain-containing protein [Saprospiraceae bacterium]MCF8251521.1 gliding motility-associated C-terminal domain-containing protein [Saprospiraceae bacterium]MCF8280851.1 gliding motility-associated C-terminal domain-containing protein [Bacteroidales bacterium]MCF8310969.1 gliding motility-associated C-terminal domain-containing protein [Saprospiraceae bacterium]MCF8439695.1 gliding motility-associated C-terminal domain-containing protein [Saprospiraceae 
MFYRYFPLFVLLFLVKNAAAQVPLPIQLEKGGKLGKQEKRMACADQFAGTISFSNFIGQSNDIDLDTIYFCYGDEIKIVHNGNANLTGDPNPLSVPGITYGYFNCPPTTTGPNLTAILTDPCIITNPAPINDLWITGGGQPNGNITFSNTGVSQNVFNNGNPVLLWFAPITLDAFPNTYEADPNTGEVGPCVNLNVDEAFAVVYLNEIKTSALNTNTGISGCKGSFKVEGGLPEFDGGNYNIAITLIGNNSVHGTILNGPATEGSTVSFQVPVPGVYTITIEDGKSCGASLLANMSSCVNVSQSIQSVSAAPTDMICLDVTNEGGFTNLVSMQYGLTWDETVLQYTGVQNLTGLLPGFTQATSFNLIGDTLIFSWASLSGVGFNVPAGTVLYQICFTVIGDDGECTDIDFVSPPSPLMIEVVNEAGSQLGFNGIDGQVCVSNSAIVINFTTTPVNCPSGMDGSFTATVNGGTAPYQVTWQNTNGGPIGGPGVINIDGGNFTANNLAVGTYGVTVSDSQGQPLVSSEQVTVTGPPSLNIVFQNVQPTCNGDADGSFCAQLISGGLPVSNPLNNYSFAWSVAGAGNTTCVSGLISGSYSVTVTNISSGCSQTSSNILGQPTPLVANVTSSPASCSGMGDGTLGVVISGGTPDNLGDYLIEWPNIGAGLTINGDMSNVIGLISDSYQLIVTDDNGCQIDQNIWLSAIKVLHANVVITPINCNSACSGGIFLTAFSTGGTIDTQFNFDWFGTPVPPPPIAETNTTTTLGGLCEGTYTVVIENLDGCEIDTTFTFTEPTGLNVALANSQNESCQPGNDGSISVSVMGATGATTFVWDNSPSTGSTAANLSAGTYTVTVTDAAMCTGSLTTSIIAPTPPIITSLPDDIVSCTSNDGNLTVTASAGSSPIVSYNWSNGLTGPTISNLAVGTYWVSVVDAGGCVSIDTAQVLASSQITIDSFQISPPQCPGLSGGNIIAFVSGGATPYFFNWSNGLVGNNIFVNSNLTAGTYALTVTDADGCPPAIDSVTLIDPPSIVVNFTGIDSVSCANTGQTCDGTALAFAMYSDGTTGLFDFIWISGETENNIDFSTAVQLCAGSQRLIVSDGICNDTFFVNIPAPLPITPGQDIKNVSCNGLADGEITLLPSGGTPPYSILWQNGTPGPTLTGLAAGNYTAVITDDNNCNFTHTVTIIEPSPFVVNLNPTQTADISCPSESDGIITVVPQGGNLNIGPAIFQWQNGVAGTNQASATGLAAGTYSVTVIDPKGCIDSLTQTITEPPPIQFILGEITPVQCFGQTTTITVDSVWGGNPTATYVFSTGACIGRLPGQLCPVVGGMHVIEIEDTFNNCVVDTTITVSEPQEISVTLPAIVVVELGDSLTMLNPTIVSSLPIDTFIWEPAENLSCANCKNPRVNGITPMTYTLTIIDINGCVATAQVYVDIDRNRNVYVPNVFSPNGDGINDKFQVFTGIGVQRINFVRLYDRWGEKIFEEKDLPPSPDGTPGWDGIFRGQEINPAVFLYLIEVEFVDGRILVYRGDVTLLK